MSNITQSSLITHAALGLDPGFIDYESLERPAHLEIIGDLKALKQRAHAAGFTLTLASGFRDFEQQLAIWNDKVLGKRTLLDGDERPVDPKRLSPRELLFTILRWSALPGASRHHWGSDVDIFDSSAVDSQYQLQLTVSETEQGGPFAPFYQWLEQELARPACPFFRPFDLDRGGVAPEPWHLSHKTVARNFQAALRPNDLIAHLKTVDILLKDVIIEHAEEIFCKYINNCRQPPC
jgi:LAS superfamily LD-carboxypeptidase LdcB